jgi:hypothetical protein
MSAESMYSKKLTASITVAVVSRRVIEARPPSFNIWSSFGGIVAPDSSAAA